jgi:hypothetical protein
MEKIDIKESKNKNSVNGVVFSFVGLIVFFILGFFLIKSSGNIFNSQIIDDFNDAKELVCSNLSTKYLVENKTWEYIVLDDKSDKEYFKKGDILIPVRACE